MSYEAKVLSPDGRGNRRAVAQMIYPLPPKARMIFVPLLDIANWSLLWLPFGLAGEWLRKEIAESGTVPNGGPAMLLGGLDSVTCLLGANRWAAA